MGLKPIDECVLHSIRNATSAHPKTGRVVAQECGCDVRQVQLSVQRLAVEYGHPICARCKSHNGNGERLPLGYFWPANRAEMEESIASLVSREAKTREHRMALERARDAYFETGDVQLRLFQEIGI